MKNLISILLSASIVLSLNSCTPEKEYIIVPGPKLQTKESQVPDLPPLEINYEVIHG